MERPSFYWGIGIENCWMAEHDEENRSPKRLLDVFLQMQHYTMWREDLDRVAALGVNALRYSVPWYRANPRPGVYDWGWIARPLVYLGRLGIIPVIDLIHYGTPLWMENGVVNHEFPERFAEYASAFARQFRGLVDHYTPHNEPQVSAVFGGLNAYWPPYLRGVDGWLKVGLNVADSMTAGAQALRAELPSVVLVSAECLMAPAAARVEEALRVTVSPEERAEFEYQVLSFPSCLAYGKVKPNSALGLGLMRAGVGPDRLERFQKGLATPNIVGHNYYPGSFAGPEDALEPGLTRSRTDLAGRLRQAHAFFQKPLYLTETSTGFTADQKAGWMRAAASVLADLRSGGMPIVGMNWWPLFETIQWDYRDNSKTVAESIRRGGWNNGLYLIEEKPDGTLERQKTAAADAYRELISGGAPAEA